MMHASPYVVEAAKRAGTYRPPVEPYTGHNEDALFVEHGTALTPPPRYIGPILWACGAFVVLCGIAGLWW